MTEMEDSRSNNVCAELDLDALAVNTLLQLHAIHDLERTAPAGAVTFDVAPQANLQVRIFSKFSRIFLIFSWPEPAL